MTTFSHRIASASGDGTVGIYDSVTGALRLSLSSANPVRAIKGSPDGSILFCAHKGPSITVWDIQTGGLVHTFVLETQAEDIAVSLTGRYLACGLSGGAVKVWQVANNTEVAAFESGLSHTHVCWLGPGEKLVIANEASVRVWDVITRKTLRIFTLNGSVRGVVFAQRLNKFVILGTSKVGSTISVVDPQTGTSFTETTAKRLSCLAFSQNTKELICGTNDSGLQLFDISVREWRQFHHPAAITSVSTLSSGFVVVNVPGSGIQFLSPDEVHTPPQQPGISVLAVRALDQGNIIAVTPNSRDRTTILESATMSPLLTITSHTRAYRTSRPQILCASFKHRMIVCCFEGKHLEVWRFGDKTPTWTHTVAGLGLVGGISPSGSRLAVLSGDGPSTFVQVWGVKDRGEYSCLPVNQSWPSPALEIKFYLEDRFYSIHEGYRIPFTISLSSAKPISMTRFGGPRIPSMGKTYSITRHDQVPLPKQQQSLPQRRYNVDGAREWVVMFSKRICWIPPGYIGSDKDSYCWIGNTLVMAGRDGVVRKLIFREQT